MPGRLLSTSFLASAAVAVLAHAGVIAGLVLLAPAGGAGPPPEGEGFEITLLELAEAEPPPELIEDVPPAPVPEAPTPEPTAPLEALPLPEASAETSLPDPIPDELPASSLSSEPEPDDTPSAIAAEPAPPSLPEEAASITHAEAAVPVPQASAPSSGAPASSASEGGADMTAYWQAVQHQLAAHAPRGVRGARDCEVEFRLSRDGEVVFVGIRASSGTPLYDRRCLRAVTNAAPFPAAPPGAAPEDLSFAIVMLQKR